MVATPVPTMVTVPFSSTVAILVCKLVKDTVSPEVAFASRLKAESVTTLLGMSAKVMF